MCILKKIYMKVLWHWICVCVKEVGKSEREVREREREMSLGSTKRPESLWVCCGMRYLHSQRCCSTKGLARGVVEHQRRVHSQDFWGTDVGGQVDTCKGIWGGWSLQLMEWDRGGGEESCWSLLSLHMASWKGELDVQHRAPGLLELATPLCLSLPLSYCSGLRRGVTAFYSAFQIMHRFLLWKIATWKHTEKESLGNIVTAKTSWHSKIHSISCSVKGGKHKTVESFKGNFGSIRVDWMGETLGVLEESSYETSNASGKDIMKNFTENMMLKVKKWKTILLKFFFYCWESSQRKTNIT